MRRAILCFDQLNLYILINEKEENFQVLKERILKFCFLPQPLNIRMCMVVERNKFWKLHIYRLDKNSLKRTNVLWFDRFCVRFWSCVPGLWRTSGCSPEWRSLAQIPFFIGRNHDFIFLFGWSTSHNALHHVGSIFVE